MVKTEGELVTRGNAVLAALLMLTAFMHLVGCGWGALLVGIIAVMQLTNPERKR